MRLIKNFSINYICNLLFCNGDSLCNQVLEKNITLVYTMPYKTRKVRGKNCYRVYNSKSKKTFAKCTSRKKADKQMRLLRALQNNKNFRKQVKERRATQRRNPK
jgi:hypothetical protein